MKLFSRQETFAVLIILFFIGVISFFNFKAALLRGRDNERENDLGDIAKLLDSYHTRFSMFPVSLSDLSAITANIPRDPGTPYGYSYIYLTDGRYFQIYASLEGGRNESQYMNSVAKLGLKCGRFICNFGKASGNTPLDKSIQVYENEINAQSK